MKRYYFQNQSVKIEGYPGFVDVTTSGKAYYNDGTGARRLDSVFIPRQCMLAITMLDEKMVYVIHKDGKLIEKKLDEKPVEPETEKSEADDGR